MRQACCSDPLRSLACYDAVCHEALIEIGHAIFAETSFLAFTQLNKNKNGKTAVLGILQIQA